MSKCEDDLITMTRDEFFEQFKPIPHFTLRTMPIWGGYIVHPLDDCEFYPVGKELEFILKQVNNPEPELFIWTHAFDSDRNRCITNGYHLIELFGRGKYRWGGYYITSKPPEEGKRYYILDNPTPAPSKCESKLCERPAVVVVSNAAGADMELCGSCYGAYTVGLNYGMGMIIELPEQMKRDRLAECLMEIRHLVNFDALMSAGRNAIEAFATGMCQTLNTNLRTTNQFKRILLSRGGY